MQGQQFKVEAGKKLFINRMEAEKGATVEFDKVLFVENEGKFKVCDNIGCIVEHTETHDVP